MQKTVKRILAYTLTLAILLSTCLFGAVTTTAEESEIAVWDGTTAENFAGGDGSASKPYLIENGAQLHLMITSYMGADYEGKNFKITKDIYLNDVRDGTSVKNLAEKYDWLEGVAAGSKANSFYGILDGDGHTIYGLYASGEKQSLGLIPAINSATVVKNLNFNNLYLRGAESWGGAIAGQAIYYTWKKTAAISNCSVTGAVIGEEGSGAFQYAAGLIGDAQEVKINFTNCYTYNNSFADWTTGAGIVANDWNNGATTYNRCYSIGYYPVSAAINKGTFNSVYTNVAAPEGTVATGIVTLTDDQMKGEAAKTNMAGFDFKYVWKTVENGYPVFGDVKIWDGSKTLTDYSTFKGSGTADDPYLIENGAQLYFAAIGNSNLTDGSCYKLANDIILNNTSIEGWEATANAWGMNKAKRFNGTLDGNGHTIEGLYINVNSTDGRYGLFSYVGQDTTVSTKVAEIKNITFVGASVTNTTTSTSFEGVGIVAGQASGETLFENIYIDETSKVNAPNVKGVAGLVARSNQKVTINNCAVLGTYTGRAHVSSFMGTFWGGSQYIYNSYSAANVPVTTSRTPTINNVYATVKTADNYYDKEVVLLTEDQMKGENAKTYMLGLSFKYVWEIVENDYPILNIRGEVWSGDKSLTDHSSFKGSGTADDPYLIENGAQLYFAAIGNSNLTDGSCYKLVNDIILNDTSVVGWEDSANTWGMNDKKRFNGTLDGDGHTIEGLYINVASTAGRYGLFSYVGQDTSVSTKVAEFKNITFVGASVTNTTTSSFEGVGIVAGQASGEALFENIYIDSTSKVYAPNVKGVAGIIARSNQKVTINNCAVHGTYTGGSHVGSFMGTFWGGSQYINNSYSAANVPVTTSRTPTITNVYATVKTEDNYYDSAVVLLTADQMTGEAAKTNMSGLDFDFLWKTTDGYPVLRDMADRLVGWDGSIATSLKGEGTKANPYKISNGAELYYAISTFSAQDYATLVENKPYFELTADINLNGAQWYGVGKTAYPQSSNYATGFAGVIYGNGHTIYNLGNALAAGVAGLIPVATQGTEIYDLHLKNGNLPKVAWNNYAAGGLIGLAVGTQYSTPIVIDGCSVESYTASSRDASGAFVGSVYSQSLIIKDCYAVNNDITHTSTAAGMNSSAFAAVHGKGNGTGNSISIENCYTDMNAKVSFENEITITYKNVYTTDEAYDNTANGLTKVTAAQLTGATAKTTLKGFNFNQFWTTVDGSTPVHTTFEYRAQYFTGNAAKGFGAGTGTEADPFVITTADELYLLATLDRTETLGKYYKLGNNITISNVYSGWNNDAPYTWAVKKAYLDGFTYTSSFAGTLDGAGYTVSGLYYNNAIVDGGNYAYGVIPFVSADAVIKNITVSDTYAVVKGDGAYVGAVAGAAHVMKEDIEADYLHAVQFVGVNVTKATIGATNKGDILGGGSYGAKFEICTTENAVHGNLLGYVAIKNCNNSTAYRKDVVTANSITVNEGTLETIRKVLLGTDKTTYVVNLDTAAAFDICDLVAAKRSMVAEDPEEYLVWSDEFGGTALNGSVWNESNSMSLGTKLEYANNKEFSGSSVSLYNLDTGKRDENGNPIYSINKGLNTAPTMSYKYGRLEMRAKIPVGAGAFPALWLSSRDAIGYDKNAEFSTEVDIFEVFGKTAGESTAIACIHKWYNEDGVKTGEECSCGSGILAGNGYKVEESDRSTELSYEWCTVVFEWTEDTMTFSINGNVYYTAKRSQMNNFDTTGHDTNSDGIFNQFMYPIVTNYMYTTGEGASYAYDGNASDILANLGNLTYEIDYIRLYQKNDGKSAINLQ